MVIINSFVVIAEKLRNSRSISFRCCYRSHCEESFRAIAAERKKVLCSDRRLFVSLVSLQNEIALHAFLQRKREMIINDCLLSILKVNDSMNESAKQPIINTNITRIQKREKFSLRI